jgi:2-desacetyl-2-hydroxyethyl bacteriochlorophyllide A dehydrogenase
MQTLMLKKPRDLIFVDQDFSSLIGNKDVEISIIMTGICGTDLAVISGREEGENNIVRGHEAVGVITKIGANVSGLKIGMRVVIDPNQYCGECEPCRSGRSNHCVGHQGGLAIAGVNIHGTFAERFVCHQRFVYPVPDGVSDEAAVLIEPVACVLHTLAAGGLKSGERLLLIGSGPMSLVAQLVCRQLGVETLALETNSHRLAFAKTLGLAILAPDALAGDEVFDAVLDSVGSQLELASQHLRRGGRILLFGFDQHYRYSLPAKHFLVNGLSIIGAGEYNQNFIAAIKTVEKIPELEKLVTHKYQLSEYQDAIAERFADGGDLAIKAVFVFPE